MNVMQGSNSGLGLCIEQSVTLAAGRKRLVTSPDKPRHFTGKLFACFPRTPVRYDVLAGVVCGSSLEIHALPT